MRPDDGSVLLYYARSMPLWACRYEQIIECRESYFSRCPARDSLLVSSQHFKYQSKRDAMVY